MLDQYRREVLPNGLRVVGVERPELHSFACSVYTRVGPRFEAPGEIGLSHFLEHMLFQGSEKLRSSSAIMRGVEDLGGVVDAETHPEFMNCVFGVHRKHWPKVMDIAADVLLRPLFDADEVEQEKSIVAQEIGQHRDRQGRNISVSELTYDLLFKEQIAETGSRGSPQILAGFGRDAVEGHYRRYFVAGNMVMCLAGGFDFDEVLAALAEQFGQLPAGPAPELQPAQVGVRRSRAVYRATEALPIVEALLCHRGYPIGHERFDAMRALCHLLGGGLSSRLFSRVREDLGLVYDIESHVQAYSDAGSLDVFLTVSVENLVKAFRATLGEVRRALDEGFAADELERYKESVRCGLDILCDRPTQLADWFGRQELFLGADRVTTPRQHVERQEALSLDDLSAAMRAIFADDGANLAVAGPFGEAESAALRELLPAEEPVVEGAAPCAPPSPPL